VFLLIVIFTNSNILSFAVLPETILLNYQRCNLLQKNYQQNVYLTTDKIIEILVGQCHVCLLSCIHVNQYSNTLQSISNSQVTCYLLNLLTNLKNQISNLSQNKTQG